jgi:hypothetical protein
VDADYADADEQLWLEPMDGETLDGNGDLPGLVKDLDEEDSEYNMDSDNEDQDIEEDEDNDDDDKEGNGSDIVQ